MEKGSGDVSQVGRNAATSTDAAQGRKSREKNPAISFLPSLQNPTHVSHWPNLDGSQLAQTHHLLPCDGEQSKGMVSNG